MTRDLSADRRTAPYGRIRPRGARRAAALALLLLGAGLAPASAVADTAPVTGTPAAVRVPVPPDPWVTPATLDEALDPGGSTGVAKQVRTPAIPPRPDVVLLVDGTGSMERPILDVRTYLPEITDKILAAEPESRFAVATFGDQEVDEPNAGFKVLQELTDDIGLVQIGVNQLRTDLGEFSMGPSEDWINGLWEIANGADGKTVFREGASPVVVLVSDASSHAPSDGHTIDDTIADLQDKGVRVIGIEVDSNLGDGLNGNGNANNPDYPDQIEDPPTTPGQATRIINATGGRLLEGIQPDETAQAIMDGFDNLPTTVGHELHDCDPHLTVALDPPTRRLTSGETAQFTENVDVSADAPQGTTLTCTVQFLQLGAQVPGTDALGPAAVPDPDFQQKISITVNDVNDPVVTVDDRTVRAEDDDGARIGFTATATDAQDGELPVTCDPASGALFPVGTTTVTCSATDSAGNTGTDTAEFEVLEPPVPPSSDIAVRVDVSPDRTYIGRPARAEFTVTNAGPDAARGVVLSAAWPAPSRAGDRTLPALNRCTAARPCTIPAGGRIEVTQTATYQAAITGDVRATVRGTLPDRRTANNRDTDRLRVLKPSLTVTPLVAKPGQPVLARGKDYPPGETVRLTWSLGITADRSGTRVGRDGTFEVQMLVLRKDTLGPRVLRADATGLPRLQEPVLVVQRNLQPPDFKGRS
ncbi:VWA domain-containing protein [Streptomyces sp. NP-1717]|uniref:VWA domain-containing protein n=1 Tax=Streptomyces sp. NP-1717 TaxID=2704470 RepID=UPI001F5E166E|nr:VWA domain-containing protein [Streptomyces sp. NP-1717]MCI3226617.1 VWA domain-containing protein [Streptomyces sp. NP-1717]